MAKIGEVEFLINFDTLGKSFADKLNDAISAAGFDTGDIDSKLDKINSHLDLLVTPFSGVREVDIVKAVGHFAQLKDPKFFDKKVAQMMSSEKILEKFGFTGVAGSAEAKKFSEDQLKIIFDDIGEMMRRTLSSDREYFLNYANLRTIQGVFDASFEGTLAYLSKRMITGLRQEKWVDAALFKKFKDDWGMDIGKTQRWWDPVKTEVPMPPGVSSKMITSYEELLIATHENLKNETIKKIFTGDPQSLITDPTALQDIEDNFVTKFGIAANEYIPRALLKAIAQLAEGIEEEDLFGTSGFIKLDVKAFLKTGKQTMDLLNTFGDQKTVAQLEHIHKVITSLLAKGKEVFIPFESKKYFDIQAKESKQKYRSILDWLFFVTPYKDVTKGATVLPKLGKLSKDIAITAAEFEKFSKTELINIVKDISVRLEKLGVFMQNDLSKMTAAELKKAFGNIAKIFGQ